MVLRYRRRADEGERPLFLPRPAGSAPVFPAPPVAFFLGQQTALPESATKAAIFRKTGGANGQNLTSGATGSGNRAVAAPEGVSGLRHPDARALREPPHGGDAVGDAAVVSEDPALRAGSLYAP